MFVTHFLSTGNERVWGWVPQGASESKSIARRTNTLLVLVFVAIKTISEYQQSWPLTLWQGIL